MLILWNNLLLRIPRINISVLILRNKIDQRQLEKEKYQQSQEISRCKIKLKMTLNQESRNNIKKNIMDQLKSVIQWKSYMKDCMITRKQSLVLEMWELKPTYWTLQVRFCQMWKEFKIDDLWLLENHLWSK